MDGGRASAGSFEHLYLAEHLELIRVKRIKSTWPSEK